MAVNILIQPTDLLLILMSNNLKDYPFNPALKQWTEICLKHNYSDRDANIFSFVNAVCEAYDAGHKIHPNDRALAAQCCLAILAAKEQGF